MAVYLFAVSLGNYFQIPALGELSGASIGRDLAAESQKSSERRNHNPHDGETHPPGNRVDLQSIFLKSTRRAEEHEKGANDDQGNGCVLEKTLEEFIQERLTFFCETPRMHFVRGAFQNAQRRLSLTILNARTTVLSI